MDGVAAGCAHPDGVFVAGPKRVGRGTFTGRITLELLEKLGTLDLLGLLCDFAALVVVTENAELPDRLIEFAWRYEGADSRSLRTHVSHLRQKMQAAKGEQA